MTELFTKQYPTICSIMRLIAFTVVPQLYGGFLQKTLDLTVTEMRPCAAPFARVQPSLLAKCCFL